MTDWKQKVQERKYFLMFECKTHSLFNIDSFISSFQEKNIYEAILSKSIWKDLRFIGLRKL